MIENPKSNFDSAKREYFYKLGLEVRPVLKMDQILGLWDREEGQHKRSWGNVTEHRLVVTARSLVLAKKLGLSEEMCESVKVGAMLHDVSKKQEKAIVKEKGTTNWMFTEEVETKVAEDLREAGFDEKVIKLSGSMGHLSIVETDKILDKPELTPEDKVWLAIHYVDGTTRNAEWYDGDRDLEKRIEKGKTDKSIRQVEEDGKERFGGKTTHEKLYQTTLRVQERLASLLSVEPEELTKQIDTWVKEEIEKL